MALNIITDNTEYVTFAEYSQTSNTSTLVNQWDIPKKAVTAVSTQPLVKREDKLGIVLIQTITMLDASAKNSVLELSPTDWALSTSPSTEFADAAAMRTSLLAMFKTKW